MKTRPKKGKSAEMENWDFFIAHAGKDKQTAQELYHLLAPHSRVFLDSECLLPGDDWDKLALAQRNSRITLVLISSDVGNAYYTREEIASAVSMAREDEQKHRVVPIYLNAAGDEVPYGLRLKHGFSVSSELSLKAISENLLQLLTRLTSGPEHQSEELSTRAEPTIPPNTKGDAHSSEKSDRKSSLVKVLILATVIAVVAAGALAAFIVKSDPLSGEIDEVTVIQDGDDAQVFIHMSVRNRGGQTSVSQYTIQIASSDSKNINFKGPAENISKSYTLPQAAGREAVVIRPEDSIIGRTAQGIDKNQRVSGWLMLHLPIPPDILRRRGVWYKVSFVNAAGINHEASYEIN